MSFRNAGGVDARPGVLPRITGAPGSAKVERCREVLGRSRRRARRRMRRRQAIGEGRVIAGVVRVCAVAKPCRSRVTLNVYERRVAARMRGALPALSTCRRRPRHVTPALPAASKKRQKAQVSPVTARCCRRDEWGEMSSRNDRGAAARKEEARKAAGGCRARCARYAVAIRRRAR